MKVVELFSESYFAESLLELVRFESLESWFGDETIWNEILFGALGKKSNLSFDGCNNLNSFEMAAVHSAPEK